MSTLHQAVADYLRIRRALGYKLERHGRLLPQFADYLSEVGASTVTTEHALSWAMQPGGDKTRWWGDRLSIVRGFASWLTTIDPAAEVPPTNLLPHRPQRATPYVYSEADIAALLRACDTIRSPMRAATYRTLIGLLAVTGMRIGEAIALNTDDVDFEHGLLRVRSGKFGKARQLALHATTVQELGNYQRLRARYRPRPQTAALLSSTTGTRLIYGNVKTTFTQLAAQAGLQPRSRSCRPRLHDLRHSFAINAILQGYRSGADTQTRLAVLATWLGHSDPAHTYWYLSAAPELLALAGQRLEQHQRGGEPT